VTELAAASLAGLIDLDKRPRTEERILEAAEQCMSRLGLHRFSMGDVAAQAGVSRGSVYLHFSDRASLIDTVLARVASRFVTSSEDAVRRRRTLAGQVGEAAVFIRQHLGDRLLTLQLPADEENLLAALMTAQIHRLVAEWVVFWEPFLADAERRGEVRPGLDRARAGEWIVRLLMSLAVMPAVTFDADDPEEVRAFVRTHLVRGLAQ
jgi:AcrR family transcriptional regulator